MECKDVYIILCAYLDGELDSVRAEAVEAHLKVCSICKRELELQQAVKILVQKRFSRPTAPDFLRSTVKFELGRAEEYRESGIQALDLIRWGTHIAQLYNTRDDITEVLVPYLKNGLEQNELCMWVTYEMSEADAGGILMEEMPDLQEYFARRQLQLFSYRNWYLSDGRLDVGKALNNAMGKCQEALSNGYSGLRSTGNVSWLDPSDWGSLMEYESLLDNAIPNHKALALCVYKESKCTRDNIVDVMDRHRYVISRTGDSWRLRRSA